MAYMRRTTPVLVRKYYGDYFDSKDGVWLCSGWVRRHFAFAPKRISLMVSTRPSLDAVAIDLRQTFERRMRYRIYDLRWGIGDNYGWEVVLFGAAAFLTQFFDAGYSTVHVSLYKVTLKG